MSISSLIKQAIPMTNTPDDIAVARRVIKTEREGLAALEEAINDQFARAISTIDDMRKTRGNRLIVAGIGKSGHVAKKIVATLASTGTPSHFVHPGEASHGDLGMVMEGDVVLMLSNSGENPELSDLIHYTRRFDIPLIAMTSNKDSALAKHADILLLLPKMPEACPNGMAPTTSTTMMLALGDALAVALLERIGLTREQFGVFHPGGKLGQKLITVGEIMHKGDGLPVINDRATMDQAILALSEKNLGCVLVIDPSGNLQGIVTDGDLKRHMAPDLLQRSVTDIMSQSPRTISEDALAVEALHIMTKTPGQYLTSLIAVDAHNKMVGLIRLQDCLQRGIA